MERVFKKVNLSDWKDWSCHDMILIAKDYFRQCDQAKNNGNIEAARRYLSLASQALEIAETKV